MAENIRLASFDIDVDALLKSAQELKRSLDDLKKEQAELRKAGQTSSAQFVKNEADLKALNSEYGKHIKIMAENTQATADQAAREQLLNAAYESEGLTINELRRQNKLLNDLRNDANLTTEEGRQEVEKLNAALDRNNQIIKENVDSMTEQRLNVGNYEQSVRDALGETNLFNGGLDGFLQRAREMGGAREAMTATFAAITNGIRSATAAGLTFIATPIGAVIAVIAVAVGSFIGLIRSATSRSEEAGTKLAEVFGAVRGVVNGLLTALQPLGEFLIDGIVKGFDLAVSAASKFREATAGLLDRLGFDSAAQDLREFNAAFNQSLADGAEYARLQTEFNKAQRDARRVQLEYQRDAEKLRQIRDDDTKSMAERIQANDLLSETLGRQLAIETSLAEKSLELAEARIKQEGETTEALDQRGQALTELADIQERITSQESEQLTNRNALLREANQQAIDRQRERLDLFIAEQGVRARTLQEELALEQQFSERKLAILKQEVNSRIITQEAYATAVLGIQQDLSMRQAEIAVENAQRELDESAQRIAREREDAIFLSDSLAEQRKVENDARLAEQVEFERLRLEQGVINQNAFDSAIREAAEANRIANKEIDAEREAVEREEEAALAALEFQDRMAVMEDQRASQSEMERARFAEQQRIQKEQLDQSLADAQISQQLYNESIRAMTAETARFNADISRAEAEQRLAIASSVLGTISDLIGKESATGKAVALAQALINTYQGITAALAAPWPMSIPAVVAAAATGFKAVKDIIKTKLPEGDSGSSQGAAVGTLGAEFQSLASNESNLSQVAASGNSTVQSQVTAASDQSVLADTVATAVKEGAREGTRTGSEEGMTNLSDNRNIRNLSTF